MNILKIKAGALQLTMFIVVVIALLLAAFIILIHSHKRFQLQTDFVKQTIEHAQYGMNYALQSNIQQKDTLSINLEDEDYKTLKVHRAHWGVFEKVVSISKIKHNRFRKIALVGTSQSTTNRTALYVKDNNKPLVVVGNSRIQGIAYLPKQGVRTGNISGHSYYGNQLIYGPSKTSKSELPKPLNNILEGIENIQNTTANTGQDQFLDINETRTYQNSFYNPLQLVYSHTVIDLSGVSLTGHILVQSKTKIIVTASSKLKDVILIAPEIDIKDHSKGAFQAFATKHITVGSYCDLNYPSALVLKEASKVKNTIETTNHKKELPVIKINKGSKIKGVVAYLGDTKNYKSQIFIDESTEVMGEVYCTQNLELLGRVYGSVMTSNFVANQSGSSYQNHLYNGEIIVDNLPQEYVGLPFEHTKKGIVKWLY